MYCDAMILSAKKKKAPIKSNGKLLEDFCSSHIASVQWQRKWMEGDHLSKAEQIYRKKHESYNILSFLIFSFLNRNCN